MLKKKKIVDNFERSSQSYFKDIKKYNVLSKEEELSLWERYRLHNDMSARDKIIKSNLKFVASVAKKYIGRGLSYSDLIAEGNMGLMTAMDRFDYTKGIKTISYSVYWINQTIMEALNLRNGITGEDLPFDYEKPLSNEDEIPTSLVEENNDDIIDDYFDSLSEEDGKNIIQRLISCLTEKEKNVITKYFGIGGIDKMTLEEIGDEISLTKERVRQIKEKALKKLRSEALNNSIVDIY